MREWFDKGFKYEALAEHEEDFVQKDATKEEPNRIYDILISNAS